MSEKDPGTTGKKLSKSDDDTLERRNKSYEKVLDAQIAYINAWQNWSPKYPTPVTELYERWKKKSEWHEKEFGW